MSYRAKVIKLLLVFVVSAKSLCCSAEDNDRISVAAGGGAGYMVNSLDIYGNLIDTKVYGHGFAEVGFRSDKTDDYYSWAFNRPTGSLGFSFLGTGAIQCKPGSSLGHLYTLYGCFQTDVLRTSCFSFGPYLDWGLTYTDKKYDASANPGNLYVGSNIIMLFGAGLEFRFHTDGHFEPGLRLGYAHRSNGMLKVPNFGLNMFQAGMFLKYNIDETEFRHRGSRPELPQFKHWAYDVYFSTGVHSCDVERGVNESLPEKQKWEPGKQWLRLNLGASCNYQYHPIFSTGLGLDLFYTQNYKRLEECEKIMTGKELHLCPVYCGAYIQQNFHYKRVMASIGLGVYLYKNLGPEDSKWNYQRVAIKYFFDKAANVFLGFAMRAHSFDRSDTWEFTIGKRF